MGQYTVVSGVISTQRNIVILQVGRVNARDCPCRCRPAEMVAMRQCLVWVNGQNENNSLCVGGGRTAKDAKYTNKNPVQTFARFAVEWGRYTDFAPGEAFGWSAVDSTLG